MLIPRQAKLKTLTVLRDVQLPVTSVYGVGEAIDETTVGGVAGLRCDEGLEEEGTPLVLQGAPSEECFSLP